MVDKITKKPDSEVIHTARVDKDGKPLCCHKWLDPDNYIHSKCKRCDKSWMSLFDSTSDSHYVYMPDYPTDHAEYLKALNEFKKEDWWEDFAYQTVRKHWGITNAIFWSNLLDPVLGTPLLADYLRNKK